MEGKRCWALNGLQRFCCSSVSGKGSLQQEMFVFETKPSELVAWQCCVITALYVGSTSSAGCIAVWVFSIYLKVIWGVLVWLNINIFSSILGS